MAKGSRRPAPTGRPVERCAECGVRATVAGPSLVINHQPFCSYKEDQ